MKRILFDVLVMTVVVTTIWYVYSTYGETIVGWFMGAPEHTIYLNDLALKVTVADDQFERTQGLSGVAKLGEFEGMLFIFPVEDRYAMWMKDMLLPLDMIWIDNDFRVVHIEEQVTPESFPARFVSAEPARFVLEVNSFFVETHKVQIGDTVTLPPIIIPADIAPEA